MSRLLVLIMFIISGSLWAQNASVQNFPVSRAKNFKVAESAFLNSDLFKAEYLFKDLIKDNAVTVKEICVWESDKAGVTYGE